MLEDFEKNHTMGAEKARVDETEPANGAGEEPRDADSPLWGAARSFRRK